MRREDKERGGQQCRSTVPPVMAVQRKDVPGPPAFHIIAVKGTPFHMQRTWKRPSYLSRYWTLTRTDTSRGTRTKLVPVMRRDRARKIIVMQDFNPTLQCK